MPALVPSDVPSLSMRTVTVDVRQLSEEVPADAWVDFTLPCDLHARADGRILAAGTRRVELVAGRGEAVLPCADPDVTTQDGDLDWVLIVRKSWHQHPYAVRIPAGSGTISLADVPPVRELTSAEKFYAITAADASATTGAAGSAATAKVSLTSGTLAFQFSIPRGDAGVRGPATTLTPGSATTLAPGTPAAFSLGALGGTATAPTQALNLSIPKGDKGDRGDPAPPLAIKGAVASSADLPATAAMGDAWLIGVDLWVWSGSWTNVGPVRGPKGEAGTSVVLDGAVTTPKMVDGAVTAAKLGDGAVLPRHIPVETRKSINNWFNVRDYGAVGDGVTDDTDAIKRAASAAGANNVVFFPKGRYRITSTITVSPDQTWQGTGIDDKGTTAGKSAMDNYIFCDIGAGVVGVVWQYNCVARDLVFVGREQGVGIGLQFSGQMETHNVSSRGFGIGVRLYNLYYGHLYSMRMIHNNVAVDCVAPCHNVSFHDVRISAVRSDGVSGTAVIGASTSELRFYGGAIEGFTTGFTQLGNCQLSLFGTYFEPFRAEGGFEGGAEGSTCIVARDNLANVTMLGCIVYLNWVKNFVDSYTPTPNATSIIVHGTQYRGSGEPSRLQVFKAVAHPMSFLDVRGGSWNVTGASQAECFINLESLSGASRVVWPDNSRVIKGPLA